MRLKLFATIALTFGALTMKAQTKYVGGDISLLTKYETNGATYFDTDGTAISELLPYFKSNGMNAMRVRLFVDPSKAPSKEIGEGVYQDLDYVKALGKRIKDAGFAFMLDFHYSDSWADPAKQYTPSAWENLSSTELYTKIYEYTKESLQAMVDAGATPDMIQIGNEISYGMLWGARSTKATTYKYYAGSSNTAITNRFHTLLSNASKACREVCPAAKIIIHTERTANISYTTTFYNAIKSAGIDYDIIGLSYYPYWHGELTNVDNALTSLANNFSDKRVMIVETGYYHNYQPDDVTFDLSSIWPISQDGQAAFAKDLVAVAAKHTNCDGVFWWSMENNAKGLDWHTITYDWYNASLFDNATGMASPAIAVLQDFITLTGISSAKADYLNGNDKPVCTLDGRRIEGSPSKGIYLRDGHKYVAK